MTQHCTSLPKNEQLYNDLGEDLETLPDWFKANRPSPNINKTKYVYFT